MLDSVLYARDKFLKPVRWCRLPDNTADIEKGGLMFPTRANIYLALFTDEEYPRSFLVMPCLLLTP